MALDKYKGYNILCWKKRQNPTFCDSKKTLKNFKKNWKKGLTFGGGRGIIIHVPHGTPQKTKQVH